MTLNDLASIKFCVCLLKTVLTLRLSTALFPSETGIHRAPAYPDIYQIGPPFVKENLSLSYCQTPLPGTPRPGPAAAQYLAMLAIGGFGASNRV